MSYRTSYGRTVRPLEKSLLSGLEDSSDGSESDESVTAGRTRSKSRVKRTGARPPCPKCFLCGEIVSDLTTHLKEHRDALKIFACHSCHRGFTSPDFYVNHRCRRKSSRKFKSTSVDELQSASHLLMLKCCGKLVMRSECLPVFYTEIFYSGLQC